MTKIKIWEFLRPEWGSVFKKISSSLRKYSPDWVEWVATPEQADFKLIHIVGSGEVAELDKHNDIIVFQHCYVTAAAGQVNYQKYWERARLSISFHPLQQYATKEIRSIKTPLGAEPDTFKPLGLAKAFDTFTTGYVAETECLDKLYLASRSAKKTMVHTGLDFAKHKQWNRETYLYRPFMSEEDLAKTLNQSRYVLAARLIEGFEVLGVEALMCGTIPIVPNLVTYDFYKGHAEILDVTDETTIQAQLETILNKPPRTIGTDELMDIRTKFAWKTIVTNIFTELQKHV